MEEVVHFFCLQRGPSPAVGGRQRNSTGFAQVGVAPCINSANFLAYSDANIARKNLQYFLKVDGY